jgi:lipid II:glycine glycyltransferase (peptidoglycan interpeptide bridge formation enzyme)
MQIEEVRDGTEWDRALLALPHPHVLQSYLWGEVKRVTGWVPRRFLLLDSGKVRAAAAVLARRLPVLRAPILYVPKGPLVAEAADAPLLEEVLDFLEQLSLEEGAVLVKIDPDWPAEARGALEALARRGWRRGEPVQFRNTVRVDLAADEATLLARMKPKTRYNIRLAERHGVVVRTGGVADLPAFFALYEETGRRDGFLIRPYAYYRVVWQAFLEAGLGQLFLAEHDGQCLAGVLAFRFGPTAWYMYGASASTKRDLMPNHLLQWTVMRWARAHGCITYDLWGAPDRLDESDPLWGVYRFKTGFGGQFVAQIGAYDYPAHPVLYRGVTWLLPRVLALWRQARGQPTLRSAGPS